MRKGHLVSVSTASGMKSFIIWFGGRKSGEYYEEHTFELFKKFYNYRKAAESLAARSKYKAPSPKIDISRFTDDIKGFNAADEAHILWSGDRWLIKKRDDK